MTVNKTENSANYPRLDSNGRYKNSLFTPSRGYHPLKVPDLIRVQIAGGETGSAT